MKMLHVTIQTDRFEEEIEFYEKVVGLTIQRDLRPAKDLVFLGNGEEGETCVEIVRTLGASNAGNPNLSIGFKTENVFAKHVELEAAGYDITPMICPMPEVRFFFVKDPAGVSVQFI